MCNVTVVTLVVVVMVVTTKVGAKFSLCAYIRNTDCSGNGSG